MFSPVVVLVVALAGLACLGLVKSEIGGRRFPMGVVWPFVVVAAVVLVLSSCGFLQLD